MSNEGKSEPKEVPKSEPKRTAVALPNGTMAGVTVENLGSQEEVFRVKSDFTLEKFKSKEALERNEPYEVVHAKKNVMLDEGANALWTLICGGGGTFFNSGNARIGVGDSNASEDPTQTGLLGGNQLYKGMDATYPQYGTARKAVFRITVPADEGNFHWWEFTVDNGAVAGKNINRKVQDFGTKPDTEIWRFTVTLQF